MPNKKFGKKKTVTVQNVFVDDWELLTKIADTLGFTMAEMVHLYADKFRLGHEDNVEMLNRLQEIKQARDAAMRGVVSGLSPAVRGFLEKDPTTKKPQTMDKLEKPDPVWTSGSTLGTYVQVYSTFGRCPKCGGILGKDGACQSYECGWRPDINFNPNFESER